MGTREEQVKVDVQATTAGSHLKARPGSQLVLALDLACCLRWRSKKENQKKKKKIPIQHLAASRQTYPQIEKGLAHRYLS
jgi:hypothetical protein